MAKYTFVQHCAYDNVAIYVDGERITKDNESSDTESVLNDLLTYLGAKTVTSECEYWEHGDGYPDLLRDLVYNELSWKRRVEVSPDIFYDPLEEKYYSVEGWEVNKDGQEVDEEDV